MYLVTGGAGFIGSNCVDYLLANGHGVRVVDNLATSDGSNLAHIREDIHEIRGDIRDLDVCRKAVAGCDVVYHLAALGSVPRSIDDPIGTNQTNIDGTLNILVAARDAHVGRVLFSSSSSVYGSNPALPKKEEMSGDPLAPYALSKLAGEQYCRLFTELYGLSTVRVRFFNVFGPRQSADHVYAAVIPKFIEAALNDDVLQIHGDGLQSRDFTYVANVVNGLFLAGSAPDDAVGGHAFNMAAGQSTSVLDVARLVSELVGTEGIREHVAARTGDIRDSLADNSKAFEAFGYQPIVDAAQGIGLTVARTKTTLTAKV